MTSLTYHIFNWSFDHTVFTALFIFMRIYKCVWMLCPLVVRLSTETTYFVSFQLLRHRRVLFLDSFRCSLLLIVAVIFTIIGILVIHLGLSLTAMAFHLFNSASAAVLCHSESFTSPSHCFVCFLVIFLSHHQPRTCSLQLLVAKVDFSLSQEVLQESHKSDYGPVR